jgi:hypothetical protein
MPSILRAKEVNCELFLRVQSSDIICVQWQSDWKIYCVIILSWRKEASVGHLRLSYRFHAEDVDYQKISTIFAANCYSLFVTVYFLPI